MGNWRHLDTRRIVDKANTITLSPASPPPASSIRLIRDILGMDKVSRTSQSDQLCFVIVTTKARKKLKQTPSCSHLHWILSFLRWRVISHFSLSPKSEDWFIPTVISKSILSYKHKGKISNSSNSGIPNTAPLTYKSCLPNTTTYKISDMCTQIQIATGR